MGDNKIHDEPSEVKHQPGRVTVTGPDGVDVDMTPDAAAKTGADLLQNASDAKGAADIEADRARRRKD